MMNKLLTILLLMLPVISVCGQDISRHEADSLLRSLNKSKTDTGRFNLLLRIARFHILKPGESKADLDSAEALINQAERLTAGIKSKQVDGHILLLKSFLISERGERELAKGMLENSIQMLKGEKDKFLLGEASLALSYSYSYLNTDARATKTRLVEEAVEAFRQSGSLERMAFCLTLLADLNIINDDEVKAFQELKLALEAYNAIHYDKMQGVYSLMARVYSRDADYSNAIRYELMAVKAAENVGDSSMMLSQIYNDLAGFLSRQGEHEKALVFLKNGLIIAEKYRDIISIFLFAKNICNAYVQLNNPFDALNLINNISKKYSKPGNGAVEFFTSFSYINIYISLKLYPKAEPFCIKLLNISKGPEAATDDIVVIYSLIIKFYIASKQYSSALAYLIKNKPLTYQLGSPVEISENYHQWFRLDSAQGNYKSALYNLAEFNKINDSIFTQTKSKQNQLLQVEYETEKKDNNIKMKEQEIQVLTQQDQLRQARLKKANFVRNVTFGGILMLLVFTGLFYRQYRQKQKANLAITQKNDLLRRLLNEKEWLLKEVHHRVKNNLHTVMSLLESQSAYLDNDALLAVQDSQHRVFAMSLIHQKLYQSDNSTAIDMSWYLPDLLNYLLDSFDTRQRIRFRSDIENIRLDVSMAIPIGLILNEAITNSIKYAFPQNADGEINIQMIKTGGKMVRLSIADNGIGLPSDWNKMLNNSLGLKLMKGLSEDIHGRFSIINNEGTKVVIEFEEEFIPNEILNR